MTSIKQIFKRFLKDRHIDTIKGELYNKIGNDQLRKLFEDRIEFKIWSAQRHLDKLIEIEHQYGGIMGINRIYAEDELDCYFAQLIGAKDALLMLINKKTGLNLHEKMFHWIQ